MLSGTLDDIGRMAPLINKMTESITVLTTTADKMLLDLQQKAPVILPIALVAGGLLGTYLITGIIANVKKIQASK